MAQPKEELYSFDRSHIPRLTTSRKNPAAILVKDNGVRIIEAARDMRRVSSKKAREVTIDTPSGNTNIHLPYGETKRATVTHTPINRQGSVRNVSIERGQYGSQSFAFETVNPNTGTPTSSFTFSSSGRLIGFELDLEHNVPAPLPLRVNPSDLYFVGATISRLKEGESPNGLRLENFAEITSSIGTTPPPTTEVVESPLLL